MLPQVHRVQENLAIHDFRRFAIPYFRVPFLLTQSPALTKADLLQLRIQPLLYLCYLYNKFLVLVLSLFCSLASGVESHVNAAKRCSDFDNWLLIDTNYPQTFIIFPPKHWLPLKRASITFILTISPIFLQCMRCYTHQCIPLHSVTASVPPVVEILTIPHQFMSGAIHAPSTNSEETLSACQPVSDSALQLYLNVFFLVPWDSYLWQRKQDWADSLWWRWDGLARLAPGKAGHFHGSIDQLLDIDCPGEGVWLWMKWLSLAEGNIWGGTRLQSVFHQ